jgi:hypothetical protein
MRQCVGLVAKVRDDNCGRRGDGGDGRRGLVGDDGADVDFWGTSKDVAGREELDEVLDGRCGDVGVICGGRGVSKMRKLGEKASRSR